MLVDTCGCLWVDVGPRRNKGEYSVQSVQSVVQSVQSVQWRLFFFSGSGRGVGRGTAE